MMYFINHNSMIKKTFKLIRIISIKSIFILIIQKILGKKFFYLFPKLIKKNFKNNNVLISKVRNEIDIIDDFINHTLSLFDTLIIIDHNSNDGTYERLLHYATIFKNVKLYRDYSVSHNHSEVINFALKNYLPINANGWIFFLDADEFLPFTSRKSFEKEINKYRHFPAISMQWKNMTPVNKNTGRILGEKYIPPIELSWFRKIAIKYDVRILSQIEITEGNHAAELTLDRSIKLPTVDGFPLMHFPIRSITQFQKKINQGVSAYSDKKCSLNDMNGQHWFYYKKILDEYLDESSNKIKTEAIHSLIESIASNYSSIKNLKLNSKHNLDFDNALVVNLSKTW